MNKIMNLRTKELFKSGLFGIIWIVAGITKFLELNIFLKLILDLVLLAASISVFIPYFVKSEKEDEMSELNKKRAKTKVCDFLTLGIMICTLVTVYKDGWVVDLKLVLPFIIGGVFLMNYILFIIYEKVGD